MAGLLLRDSCADVGVVTQPEGLSALHLAARWGHVPVLQLLISQVQSEQTAPVREPAAAVQDACEKLDSREATTGALKRLLGLRSKRGLTALDEACAWGRRLCCEHLATTMKNACCFEG